jgi:hypothetical protein
MSLKMPRLRSLRGMDAKLKLTAAGITITHLQKRRICPRTIPFIIPFSCTPPTTPHMTFHTQKK